MPRGLPLVVLTALAVVALLVLARDRGGGQAVEPRTGPSSSADRAADLADGAREAASPRARERPDAGAGGEAPAADPRPTPVDEDGDAALLVRVERPDGAPFAGADVRVERRSRSTYSFLGPREPDEDVVAAEGSTDDAGRFTALLDRGIAYVVHVDAPPFARESRGPVGADAECVVRLRAGATVRGRVVERPGGEPAPDARVELRLRRAEFESSAPAGRPWRVACDANGAFVVECVSPGAWTIRADAEGLVRGRSRELDLVAGETTEVLLELERGLDVVGLVVDARTGTPIAGAAVARSHRFESPVPTDASGTFRLHGVRAGRLELHAQAEGYGTDEAVFTVVAGEGPNEVTLELAPGRTCVGRVVDRSGAPVPASVVAAATEHRDAPVHQVIDWHRTRTGPDGTFRLEGLRASLRHELVVRAPGHGTRVEALPADELERDLVDVGDVVVAPAGSIAGRFVDEEGRPWSGADVVVRGTNADRYARLDEAPEGYRLLDAYVSERSVRTDARGRFAVGELSAGTYTVTARRPGGRDSARVSVDVADGARRGGLELVLPRGLSIEGRVLVPDGGPVPKVYVSVDPLDRGGARRSTDVEASVDGRFEAPGLDAGLHRLSVYPYPRPEDVPRGRLFRYATVERVEAGARGVEVVLEPRAVVAGRVEDAEGEPVPNAFVAAVGPGGEEVGRATSDEAGRYLVEVEGGAETVRLGAARGAADPDARADGVRSAAEAARADGVRARVAPGVHVLRVE